MHSSLDVFPHLKNGLRFFWKFCLNLCLQKWLRPNFNLVFILIPLGLWQFKIKFEDNLVNSQILFLEAQRTSEFLIFKSDLFHSMKVNRKENCWKKIMFTNVEGNVIISSCIIICFANARRYFEKILRKLIFKSFEKVSLPSISLFFLYYHFLRSDSTPSSW